MRETDCEAWFENCIKTEEARSDVVQEAPVPFLGDGDPARDQTSLGSSSSWSSNSQRVDCRSGSASLSCL